MLSPADLERILLRAMDYLNAEKIRTSFPYDRDFVLSGYRPTAKDIFEYGKTKEERHLAFPEKEFFDRVLLPKGFAKFTRNGLIFAGVRYRNRDYYEKMLAGTETAIVSYDPEDMSRIYLNESDGSYVPFDLMQEKYRGLSFAEAADFEMNSYSRYLLADRLHEIYYPTKTSMDIYFMLYQTFLANLPAEPGGRKYERYAADASLRNAGHFQPMPRIGRSCSVIGPSGIGKTQAVRRALSLILGDERVLDTETGPMLPYLYAQTPFDSSPKGFMVNILHLLEEHLHIRLLSKTQRLPRIDSLIELLCSVCSASALSTISLGVLMSRSKSI